MKARRRRLWGGIATTFLLASVAAVPLYALTSTEKDKTWVRGKIPLLSENAEVFFRNIELRPIREIPPRFLKN